MTAAEAVGENGVWYMIYCVLTIVLLFIGCSIRERNIRKNRERREEMYRKMPQYVLGELDARNKRNRVDYYSNPVEQAAYDLGYKEQKVRTALIEAFEEF